ncbi:hypothetical protein TNCV_1916021 [Trichonephila clavipes]|uniref:Uncharacterized protein n=1 Tax=Trichonephila clavipes TaxID=2585209 RepID=A0A8X6W074_TRICX|nr:hypothetical protein TNCV_1916021 [Trichonephila clavipes]
METIGQMDIGVYGMRHLNANTLQPLPERSRMEAGALWFGECFPGLLWVHSSLWNARWINTNTYLYLRTLSTPICALFFLRMMASTSRTTQSVIQLAVHVLGSKSTRMSYCPPLASKLT